MGFRLIQKISGVVFALPYSPVDVPLNLKQHFASAKTILWPEPLRTMKKLSLRDKSVLAGLYLSKFDGSGLERLGFDSFVEAFNVVGLALGVRPASIKNYRDEFDPLFPNERKGWHKRPMRDYCMAVYKSFGELDAINFSMLLKRIIYKEKDIDILMEEIEQRDGGPDTTFAKRLITGQAAEQYFRSNYKEIDIFNDLELEDTTRLGCGFDFRLHSPTMFYGVEVKGLNELTGSVTLTSKEHSVASILKDRYFLFVVKNFKEKPLHVFYQNPLASNLVFARTEQKAIQINWTAKV